VQALAAPVVAQQLLATIPVGATPKRTAINPITNKTYVTNAMSINWSVPAAIFLYLRLPVAAQSDVYRHCMEYHSLNPDFAIQECSAAIQSGLLAGSEHKP
jgi:hypothetical protein